MNITMTVTETDFVRVELSDMPEGVERDDLAGFEMAIVVRGTAVEETDWLEAEAVPDSDTQIRVLVGPNDGALELEVGTYNIWTRLTWGPLQVERKAGGLKAITTA